jgi:large conductance mechanosensitive channel
MRSWGTEFKQFLLRGNVVDLAVGIVIGAAFAAVVQAAVADLLTPLVAAIFGQRDFNPSTRKCPQCISEIPIDARRCAFCTSEVAPV